MGKHATFPARDALASRVRLHKSQILKYKITNILLIDIFSDKRRTINMMKKYKVREELAPYVERILFRCYYKYEPDFDEETNTDYMD